MAEVALGLAAFAGISGALAVGTIALGESLQEGSDQIGPRADTQPYLSGSEGRILPFVLGPNNRVGGIVIWLPSLVEVEDTETTGGGMFSSTSPESSQTTFQYLADVAIAFADGPIEEGVQQIFVNGDMVWAPTGTTSVNGTDITCTTNGWLGNILFNLGGVGGVFYSAPSGGTDLAQFRVGAQIQVSGFTTAANNGTFLITNVGSTSSGGTYIRVVGDFLASNEAAGDSVTLTQLQITLPNSFANSFVEYKGDGTNTVEPIIQARESEFNNQTGRTPQYNQTAYGVFQGLQVSPYGNRVPQITMNLSQATSLSVAEGVTKLMNRVGIPPEYLDLSDVEDIFIRGMVLDRSFSLEQALRPLLVAYDLILQDRNRTTKLVKRYEADEVTVPEADFLRVQEVGPYQLIEPISDNLPRQVTVNYRDVNNDNQLASQGERRQNTEDGLDSEINLSIPLSLTAGEAKSIAYRELYRLWQRRRKFQFSLPPKWLEIQEGDVINTTVSGIDYRLIVVKLDVGANFQINIEAEVDLGDSPTITGQPPVQTDQVVDVPSPIAWSVVDIAPMFAGHENSSFAYLAMARADFTSSWRGAVGYLSEDNDLYQLLGGTSAEGIVGFTTSALAAVEGHEWDRDSTLNVDVGNHTLSSVTEAAVLAGQNWAVVGDEVIGFVNATQLSDGTYDLDTFLRYRRDTFGVTHTATERFCMVRNITAVELPLAYINTIGYIKCMPPGEDLSNVQETQHTYLGKCITRFRVGGLKAIKTDGDVVSTWNTKHRGVYNLLTMANTPFQRSLSFTVTYKKNAVQVRTRTVTAETDTYTAAEQTTDGFTGGETLSVHVKENGIESVLEGDETSVSLTY